MLRHIVTAIATVSSCFAEAQLLLNRSKPVVSRMFSTIERGAPYSYNYRVYLSDGKSPISTFHDIPYLADEEKKIYNMVVEIPRWTNAKMEIATKERLNPIKQDIKKGALRFTHNVFPHHGYIWNYGAIPQTWEDPNHVDESTGCQGDNDPIDVCEIGYRVAKQGEVLKIKVLGIIALIDEGETDWKLIAIDTEDPLAESLNGIEDVQKNMPGLLRATVEWFRFYKVPAGNPENKFAFNGEPKDKEFAQNIIDQTHVQWKKLVTNPDDTSGLSCSSVSVEDSPYKIERTEASAVVDEAAEFGSAHDVDPVVDKWFFITRK